MKTLIVTVFALALLGSSAARAGIVIGIGDGHHRHQVCEIHHHHRVCHWR